MFRILRFAVGLGVATALAACVTAPQQVRDRETFWRELLAEQAPRGTPRASVAALFDDWSLPYGTGTYRTVSDEGVSTSNCRLPARALSGMERGAVRGLYIDWDVEVTVCFDEADRVENHFVGAWNAGL